MRKHLSALLTAALFISSSFVPVMMISSTVHATDMKESNAIVLSDPSIETRSYASYSGLKDEVVTLDPVGIMTEEDRIRHLHRHHRGTCTRAGHREADRSLHYVSMCFV